MTTDLDDFNMIVPCGLEGRGVTSMAGALGRAPDMAAVGREIAAQLAALWGFTRAWAGLGAVEGRL